MTTQEQKKFIVYRSSAGSGKTFTLVREYLKLALSSDNPYRFRRILAVTFTNKAAGEMKERVLDTLRALTAERDSERFDASLWHNYLEFTGLEEPVLRIRASQTLSAMLHNYADLSISTIDRFVHRIIRTFARDLQLSSDFEIETNGDALLREAIDDLLSEVGRHELLTRILIDFVEYKTEEEGSWTIEQDLFRFSKILFREDSLLPVESLREIPEEAYVALRKAIGKQVRRIEQEVSDRASEALRLMRQQQLEISDFAYGKAGVANYFVKLAGGDLSAGEPGTRVQDVLAGKPWYTAKAEPRIKAAIDAISSDLHRLLSQLADLYEKESGSYVLLNSFQKNLYNLALLQEINRRFEKLREAQNLLLISDFNKLIAQVVLYEPAPFIYERLGERYTNFLIDEFQDTSVLQWQNFIPLLENALSQNHYNLVVGDSKQSIYRFRNGEMEQLAVLPQFYGHGENQVLLEKQAVFARNYRTNVLNTNYRSRRAIVEFNNAFFASFASKFDHPLRSIYNDVAQEVLPSKEGGYVELSVIPAADRETRNEEVWKSTLQKMRDCLEDGFSLRDLTVLVRSNREGSEIATFLSRQGIPVVSQDSLLVGSSLPVQLLVALLRWMHRRNEDTERARVIAAYLHWKEPETSLLAAMAEKDPERKAKPDPLHFFRARTGSDFSVAAYVRLPLYERVEQLVKRFEIPVYDVFVNGFLDAVFAFSQRSGDTAEFLEWWEEKGHETPVRMPEASDAVTIMTIHKSKGLQFPVVFIPFANWKIRNGKDNLWVPLTEEFAPLSYALLPASRAVLGKSGYVAQVTEEEVKTRLDHLNLLYVAFTRPEERLYIFTDDRKGAYISEEVRTHFPSEKMQELQQGVYALGTRHKFTAQKRPSSSPHLTLQAAINPFWRDRIRISFEAYRTWGPASLEASARFGNQVHRALSLMVRVSDSEKVLQQMKAKGELTEEELPTISAQLQQVLAHPFIAALYSGEGKMRNEIEIVDQEGQAYRPDSVVSYPDRTVVVDFKTGNPEETHSAQVRLYGRLLEEMGFPSVEKYLFYTAQLPPSLVRVE